MKLDRKIYHSADLELLWNISNKNTLYTAIKRYVKKGILIPIYKGLYATVPISQLEPLELGRAIIHNYTYVSTETIFARSGIISQAVYGYTFVAQLSKKITIGNNTFIYRQLHERYLNNRFGIEDQNGIFTATLERAIADMLYFDPHYHFDLAQHINWDKVKIAQKEIGYIGYI